MPRTQHAFLHFSELPLTLRVVYTGGLIVLGIGYLFAMMHIYFSHAGRDGRPGLTTSDLVIAYQGSKQETRLEAALNGSMSGMLPPEERDIIFAWVGRGAGLEGFEAQIRPILDKRCVVCHDGSNAHIPRLLTYDDLTKLTDADTGMSLVTLIRVSHIHLLGISFIFILVGLIFSHAYMRPGWLKAAIAGAPFLFLTIDVASWYLTKFYQPFAWIVILSGGFMGAAFAAMWFLSLYQLWFYKLPEAAGMRRDVL